MVLQKIVQGTLVIAMAAAASACGDSKVGPDNFGMEDVSADNDGGRTDLGSGTTNGFGNSAAANVAGDPAGMTPDIPVGAPSMGADSANEPGRASSSGVATPTTQP